MPKTLNGSKFLDLSYIKEQLVRQVPYSVDSTLGKKTQGTIRDITLRYFEALQRTFPEEEIEQVVKTVSAKEVESFPYKTAMKTLTANFGRGFGFSPEEMLQEQAVDVEIASIIAEWFEDHHEVLTTELVDEFSIAVAAGEAEAITEWAGRLGVAGVASPEVDAAILKWSRDNVGELITSIDETTRKRIASIVTNGIEQQVGVPNIMRDIRDFITDDQMTKERAELIARTETNRVLSHGAYTANQEVGANEKEWVTVGDDRVSKDICLPNEGEGRIKIDTNFGSGDPYPPGHPRCRCTAVYYGADPDKVRDLL